MMSFMTQFSAALCVKRVCGHVSSLRRVLTAECLSAQCDGLKDELLELQQLYDGSQRERAALEQELQRCKAELHKLAGRKSQVRGQRSEVTSSGVFVNYGMFLFYSPECDS